MSATEWPPAAQVAAAGPPRLLYEPVVLAALREDLGRAGDITTDAVVAPRTWAEGRVVIRRPGRIAGLEVALSAFALLDPTVAVAVRSADGADAWAGETLAHVRGPARAVLGGERTALNLLGHLCGVATATRDLVRAVEGTSARIVCTRKTTPGLRTLEKYAVRCGGGFNHRFGLDDAVLIKDNHLALAGGVAEAVRRTRQCVGHLVKIEVEVTDLPELEEALALGVDAVLLDNMDLETLASAVRLVQGRAVTEASGSIRPENAAAVAATGVDLLSVGWITHSAPALDVALDVVPSARGDDLA